MRDDSLHSPLRRRGYLRRRRKISLDQAEQVGSGAPAQDGTLTAGFYSGDVAGFEAGSGVADAIHAGVLPNQRARAQSILDLVSRHAEPE